MFPKFPFIELVSKFPNYSPDSNKYFKRIHRNNYLPTSTMKTDKCTVNKTQNKQNTQNIIDKKYLRDYHRKSVVTFLKGK